MCTTLLVVPDNPDYTEVIFFAGYTLSLVALLVACAMFLYFK
jgi:hypothetical protein